MAGERVGLVLTGGGARGAYEMGALSVLLPTLEAAGQLPTVLVGTSVGAINIAYLAAAAHLGADGAVAGGIELWHSMRWEQVLAPLLSPSTVLRMLSYVADVLGVPGVSLKALLDTTPLTDTVQQVIDFAQLHRNVESGRVHATAVVGTSALTSESVVFVEGGTLPPEDVGAGLDYVATRLTDEHVRASTAIPLVFPAVHVSQPARARGWYLDGGARLNTPVRPALSLGVDRLVVIGLNAIAEASHALSADEQPDAFAGAGTLVEGALADSLVQDVRSLARVNQMLGDRSDVVRATDGWRYRRIPFIYVAPTLRQEIDQLAERVFAENYEGRNALRSINLALLARLIGGSAGHGALLSYLFFAPEFAAALIELGRTHAQHWLATHTGPDGPWQLDSADPAP
ncbi:MAG: patatin-like phospholipase family protein [Betaproteobacteria bacterium]